MFLLGLLFVMMASGFALLWVYAGGDLSAKNIRKTMPVLRRDVDAYFLTVGKKAEVAFEGAKPYVKARIVKYIKGGPFPGNSVTLFLGPAHHRHRSYISAML